MEPVLILGLLAAGGWGAGSFVFARVRPWCEAKPMLRPWLIAAGVVVLVLVAVRIPRIGDLEPPWSESPSGLFLIATRVAILGALLVAGVATIAAASVPLRSDTVE
jgi:hypothetical protein